MSIYLYIDINNSMAFLNFSSAGSILSRAPPSSPTPWFKLQAAPRPRERLKFEKGRRRKRRRGGLVCCSSPAKEVGLERESEKCIDVVEDEYLVREYGWGVRRMAQVEKEMRSVAHVQAEAFHLPVVLFNNLFFEFFKAEVLAALIYKIRNSPPDRYACLVAESVDANDAERAAEMGLVGVVDVTVQRDEDVLKHLQGVEEYLYVSGIGVLKKFRRQRVATALLQACDKLAILWGFNSLALRVYEDDSAAQNLYANAGYKVVFVDPHWLGLIGRKRRVLMDATMS
ncbi:hypothetical protein J5N97_022285 [Dioscorea zingiberensis]|uniref:N-acetyltransferase domain-containing protein n=1 Tax=Dioscorea zingiberensis TaxID=325984 RepID=A0A9D5HAV0_9LILI|nr:hypothetical protein J5N97_022285 [Dioscorea zingiberensis]